jgi:hypothetical protein
MEVPTLMKARACDLKACKQLQEVFPVRLGRFAGRPAEQQVCTAYMVYTASVPVLSRIDLWAESTACVQVER